jgi:mono/diheme cytochrome c family protein
MTVRTILLRVALTTLPLAAILAATNLTHTRVHAADPHPSSAPPPVTWSHDIAPLAYKNCSTCHHTGGAGPFSLLTYEDARRWGAQMQDVTQSRYMPPWLPEHRRAAASYIAFQDERILTDAEINLIAAWVKSGMPEGNPADAPPIPHYSETWQYGKPDLILKVQRPYMLEASGNDVFRNFVLPYPARTNPLHSRHGDPPWRSADRPSRQRPYRSHRVLSPRTPRRLAGRHPRHGARR